MTNDVVAWPNSNVDKEDRINVRDTNVHHCTSYKQSNSTDTQGSTCNQVNLQTGIKKTARLEQMRTSL